MNWLPDMDLNHDKQIQSLLCYRYTIGQAGAFGKLEGLAAQSSRQSKLERIDVRLSLVPALSLGEKGALVPRWDKFRSARAVRVSRFTFHKHAV